MRFDTNFKIQDNNKFLKLIVYKVPLLFLQADGRIQKLKSSFLIELFIVEFSKLFLENSI
ncbi:MAG TPA: hypothetical protein DCL77_09975 [Prolixibacteraceae bacterium]|nr:hypothetical protein [Prolixibacteraceae bacterium]